MHPFEEVLTFHPNTVAKLLPGFKIRYAISLVFFVLSVLLARHVTVEKSLRNETNEDCFW